ncbi:hypothetical protein MSAN_02293400 [Mycena sanguinolenta]|uniref:F-box domain-containing protein n=1 Tax=Mycena sanguinolenta TaxID=230812 RepID=A0A8H7CHY1_9AGAR|nr:hypothetical protein MSAN_02293400 [Mycena sanguinolenta]
MLLPEDIFSRVVDAVAATNPRSLRAMALVCRQAHALIKRRWFRVLCVQDGWARREERRTGFPRVTYDRFVELLWRRPDEMERVQHLHIRTARRGDVLRPVLEGCPGLTTLWLQHRCPGPQPSIVGLDRLRHLRELTMSTFRFLGEGRVGDLVLPTVTHLHFAPVPVGEPLHLPALLAALPHLTHVGFEQDTHRGCPRAVAESSDACRVVVLATSAAGCEDHPRIVYVHRSCRSPEWGQRGMSDQWAILDHVLAARDQGQQLGTPTSVFRHAHTGGRVH